MVLWGSIVNALAIIAGGVIGLLIPSLNEQLRRTVIQGMGIALCVLGIMMAMKTTQYFWMVISLVAGGVLGEWIGVEKRFDQLGRWLESKVKGTGEGSVGQGFVTTTLIFCIGAMAILGPIDSGIRLNHDVLYTKSLMDGFLAVVFSSMLGIGVLFSAAPVLIYQGSIALAAAFVASAYSPDFLQAVTLEVSAVGGVLIIGVGLNILEIKKIHVANLLPSLLVMAVVMSFIL
ncbi:DUF554 domain-containing protein [Paenibacillus turpanensis]|uniref:DUF554 domain-containing protein n=1 Tax=Paenibacillus turpanensis TaxID=2689078 RepID=UPI00140960F8|nr:DUF554 domain-containing protein [Paenibacillus turpanensis]